MRREDWAWLGFWAGFAALDMYADSRGKSLCASVRHVFHTDTPEGRRRLTRVYGIGALGLLGHLMKRPHLN